MDNFDLKKYLAEGKLNEKSNPAKTAVELIKSYFYSYAEPFNGFSEEDKWTITENDFEKIIKQAKEIERQQIMDAFEFAQNDLGMEADEYINYMNLK